MEFKDHLQILRACRIYRGNITKGALIRQIYLIIEEHQTRIIKCPKCGHVFGESKQFKDLDDFFSKLYPNRVIQRVGAGVNIRHRPRRRPKREPPFYSTEVQDLEKEAEE